MADEKKREATQEEVDAMFDSWMAGGGLLSFISENGVRTINNDNINPFKKGKTFKDFEGRENF